MSQDKIDSFLVRVEYVDNVLHLTAQNIITGEQQDFASYNELISFLDCDEQLKINYDEKATIKLTKKQDS